MLNEAQEAMRRLTEREYAYWLAKRANQDLDEFGEDIELLEKSVQAKLSAVEAVERVSKEQFHERGDGPAPTSRHDILDGMPMHVPFERHEITVGDKVLLACSGTIHRVVGVDRSKTPHLIKIDLNGRMIKLPRDQVSKSAPDKYKISAKRLQAYRDGKTLARPTTAWFSDQDD